MKINIRRGRKIGDPNYSSTDVGLELALDCDDELYYDRPAEFAAWFGVQCQTADELLEAEIRRIYASRPAPVETAAQRDERRPEPAAARTNGNGYHANGDREIERSRSREEPRGGDGAAAGGGYERPDERRRDDRGRPDDRRGGGGGGPNPGKKLLAWARGKDEEGAGGVERYIKDWAKDRGVFGMWQDWDRRDVDDAREAAVKWIDGDQR
jgi:hypothetical protein